MKKIKFCGEILEAESIEKQGLDIIGTIQGKEVFSLRSVHEISKFELENGASFDEPRISDDELKVMADTMSEILLGV